MILNYFGKNVSYDDIKNKAKIDESGLSAYEFIRLSKFYGINATGYKNYLISDIKDFPVVAHTINNNVQHFVVIEGKNDKSILVKDPAKGKYLISNNDFKKIYTGVLVVFQKDDSIIKNKIINKKFILLVTIILLVFTFLNILYSYLISYLIENYKTLNGGIILIVIFFILGIFKEVICFLKDRILLKYQLLTDELITIPTLKKIISLPHHFYQNKPVGELISKINDLSYVKEMIYAFVQVLFVNLVIILISFIFILFINKFIFLLNFVLIILTSLFHKKFYYKTSYRNYDLQLKNEALNAKISDVIESINCVKNLAKETYFIEKIKRLYTNALDCYKKQSMLYQNKNFLFQVSIFVLSFLSIVILFNTNESVTNVLFIIYMESFLYDSLYSILNLWPLLINAKASYVRMGEIHREGELKNDGKLINVDSILLKKVYYKIGDNLIFKDVNLNLFKGELSLVNGPSGSGKTTVFKMLTGQDNMKIKNVFINGKPMDLYKRDTIRKTITYVEQKIRLFNDTILENICLGNKLNLKNNFKSLLEIEFRKKRINYDTLINNTNSNLSGGEISLIKIAQTLNNSGSVIIFDETTSQMDVSLERKVLMALRKDYDDKIIVLISHRLSNGDLFDKIVDFGSKKSNNKRRYR